MDEKAKHMLDPEKTLAEAEERGYRKGYEFAATLHRKSEVGQLILFLIFVSISFILGYISPNTAITLCGVFIFAYGITERIYAPDKDIKFRFNSLEGISFIIGMMLIIIGLFMHN